MAYRFQNTGKYLVCLDQTVWNLTRTAVIGFRENGLASLGLSMSIVMRFLKILIRSKFSVVSPDRFVMMPAFGHIGMQVHRGVKLFDLRRREVTKVFTSHDSAELAEQEISASKTASKLSAAPRFLRADVDLNWFSEEYICGEHGSAVVAKHSSDFLKYYAEVEKCLLELALSVPPKTVRMRDHVEGLIEPNFAERWLAAGIDAADVSLVSTYIEKLQQWLLDQAGDENIALVLSHGDFSMVNAILTDGGLRFVDWEGVALRSAPGDALNFAFTEAFYERVTDQFVSETQGVFEHYRKAFRARFPDLTEAVSQSDEIAQRLYYLERIRVMLDRDVTPNLGHVVTRSISLFQDFDAATDREML